MRNALHVARTAPMLPPALSRPLIALVFEGLSEEPRQLPATLAFDARGADLYDALRDQPEHYPARVEDELLVRHANDIAATAGARAALLDYGAGDGRQARIILRALQHPGAYVPIEVEPSQLRRLRLGMRVSGDRTPLHPLCQDLRAHVALPLAAGRCERRVALLGGSPFDTFRPLEAVAVLNSIRETVGRDGALIVGIDLRKDPSLMSRAYADQSGCAAALGRNVLARINRELEGHFDVDAYEHEATWNEEHQRVEVLLRSRVTQVPRVAGISIALGKGEEIVTQHSYKYTEEGFATLARIAGWDIAAAWADESHDYRVYCLRSGSD